MRQAYALDVVRQRTQKVVGAITPNEEAALYGLAAQGPGAGVIVEIGSWQGRSTIYLASGSKGAKREKVYAIDPHQGSRVVGKRFSGPTYQAFLHNLHQAQVADWVVPLRTTSYQAVKTWRRPIRLLFIDGNHSYTAVSQDLKLWEPWVVEGGVIALHDVLNPAVGPVRALRQYLIRRKKVAQLKTIDSLAYCVKRPPRSVVEWFNYWVYAGLLAVVEALLRGSFGSTRFRQVMRQYVVKRWLKQVMSWVTMLQTPAGKVRDLNGI